jgi:hypothetical protein
LKKTNRNSHFEENQQEQPLWRKPTGTATLKKTNRNSNFADQLIFCFWWNRYFIKCW